MRLKNTSNLENGGGVLVAIKQRTWVRPFFEKIGGDNSSVIGLPICELLSSLWSLGISPLTNPKGPWDLQL